MTIAEITKQLSSLSVGMYFNHEKFTQKQLRTYISNMLRSPGVLTMEIALPDGWWYFNIFRYEDGCCQYVIPETRQQENHIKSRLFSKA